MNATESNHTRIHLVLNVQEARWLKDYLQNSNDVPGLAEESPEETKQRVDFFEALNELPSLRTGVHNVV